MSDNAKFYYNVADIVLWKSNLYNDIVNSNLGEKLGHCDWTTALPRVVCALFQKEIT